MKKIPCEGFGCMGLGYGLIAIYMVFAFSSSVFVIQLLFLLWLIFRKEQPSKMWVKILLVIVLAVPYLFAIFFFLQ